MYYQRYLSLFVLEEFSGVVRDTSRNLRVLDLCGKFGLDEQDRLMRVVLKHLRQRGRFWADLFNPDPVRLAQPQSLGLEPFIFHVPPLDRTVFKSTDIRRSPHRQVQRVTFNYTWFDANGAERRAKTRFDMTWLFPREFQLLVERHGLRVERLFGNYDGSPLDDDSPRMIARCCRA